ncbi:thiamine-monophosphate kinase [Isosphaera pallida ATCC 43644]|uniref:Thiamine-monophosphate kinase n=1 Tax=Isosphaera pallida (strain ATCC 43644 / DSM 9630 / IS1B) TaxID=575540 RepID=E8QY35_ISOPI|nr:thiamine-phosphate kinase [Isosphaera pallida]ADV62025.1 thiamine-monophosphate kinase [Isosphaera pallida ATCC 43644]
MSQAQGEFDLIRRIQAAARPGASRPGIVLGIGDDAALLQPPPGHLVVVTTDMLMDGRHFILAEHGAEAVGIKAMGVNLSDLAAMAALPWAAFASVALPRTSEVGDANAIAHGLLQGIRRVSEDHQMVLAGGDTNAWDGPLVVSITLLGLVEDDPPGAVFRSGARPGDTLAVTGPLGGSILGRHLRPQPRIAEARALRAHLKLHALIDLSDGLASDLRRLSEASNGWGIELDEWAIPIHDDAQRLAQMSGRSPLDHALNDGEDFELCLATPETLDPDRLANLPTHLIPIGRVVDRPGFFLRAANGMIRPLEPGGFDHLRDSTNS